MEGFAAVFPVDAGKAWHVDRRRRGEGSAELASDPVWKIFGLPWWRSVHVERAVRAVEIGRLRATSCCNDSTP